MRIEHGPLTGWHVDEDFARRIDEATAFLRERGFGAAPVGVILGSGLGNVVDRLEVEREIPFGEIPGFHAPTVLAHRGRLVEGRVGDDCAPA